MLTNKSLTMCQDVTLNTSEGKAMMYAITWNDAGTMMVQVGLKPQRLLEKWRGKNVDSMTISYGCVGSLEEDWENIYDIAKEADRRMYESKARYYRDSGIDRRK